MEKLFYEYRPHLCFAFAIYAYKYAPHSQFQMFCAASLCASGLYLLFLRNRQRVLQFLRIRR